MLVSPPTGRSQVPIYPYALAKDECQDPENLQLAVRREQHWAVVHCRALLDRYENVDPTTINEV